MIINSLKLIKALKKLNPSTNDYISFDTDTHMLQIIENYHNIVRAYPLKLSRDAYIESINDLASNGYIEIHKYMGGFFFSILSKFVIRKEYYLEAFTRKFWNGYILGVLSGLSVEAIIHYAPILLSRLSQWIQTLSSFR